MPPADPGATRTNLHGEAILAPGTLLADRYRILELVGTGAMGMVYRADDETLGVEVALKVLRPELAVDDTVRERFRRELVLARQVSHPHVVRIHDLGEHRQGGTVLRFLTMDHVSGRSLRRLLADDGALPPERAAEIAGQLAEALAAAHRQEVVHRDLKPANVLVGDDGAARITDFGVARSLSAPGLTRTGGVVGTPDYLSPEQAAGEPVDARSDLYALGLLLFEMLTGEPPFAGGTPAEVIGRRLAAPAPRPSDAGVEVPAELERILARCLARAPEERYQDASALARDLEACLGRPRGGAPVAGARRPAARLLRVPGRLHLPRRLRSRRAAAAVAAGLLLLALAAVWWLGGRGTSGPAAPGAGRGVAILPLADATGRPDLAWASTGVAEMLASGLAESPSLRVVDAARVARTLETLGLTERVAGSVPPAEARRLGELLDVDRLVAGTLRSSGERLRIDARLISVDAPERPAARIEVASGADGDLFALIERLGAELRGSLEVEDPAGRGTTSSVAPAALASYARGLDLLGRGDAVGAEPLFAEAVESDPDFGAAWLRLAAARDALGRGQTALDAARRAVEELPGAGRLSYEARALAASLAGEPEEARRILGELVERYPHAAAARVSLAEAYGQEGLFERASELLEEVVREEPNHPRAWFLLGKYAILAGDSRRAADDYLVRALVIQNRLDNDQGRADVLNAMGIAHGDLGEPERALERYREAAELRREIGDRRGYAATLTNIGMLEFLGGELDAGRGRLLEAKAILEELGDRRGMADLENELGVLEEEGGRYAQALEHYRRALAARSELADRRALAESYNNVGFAYHLLGEYDNAGVYWQQALETYRQTGNREGMVIATQSLGLLDLARGRWDRALERFLAALEESRELGLPDAEAVSLGNLGRVAQYQGRYAAALDSFDRASEIVDRLGDLRGRAEFSLFRASALLELGLDARAEEELTAAAGWIDEAGNREQRAVLDRLRGELALRGGRRGEARRAFQGALARARESGSLLAELEARLGAARAQRAAGRPAAAAAVAEELAEQAALRGAGTFRLQAVAELARCRLAAGDPGAAAEAAEEALRELGERSWSGSWRLHRIAAAAREALGDAERAEGHRRAAAEEVERVTDGLGEEQRQAFDSLREEEGFDVAA